MGILTWIAAATLALLVARIIPRARTSLGMEAGIAVTATLISGMAATAMDFGGWKVVDWRGAVFTFSCSAAAIAAWRLHQARPVRRSKRSVDQAPGTGTPARSNEGGDP